MESFRFAIFIHGIYGIHCICWAFRCVSYYFLCHIRISIQSHSPSVRLSARPPVRPFRLYGTVNVLFVTYVRLLFAVSVCSACSVPRFPFCFVPLRRLLTNFVCLLLCSLSLSFSHYACLPLTLTFLAIFTRAFNIHHLFIVGVERLPGAPFFLVTSRTVLLLLLLCHCVFAYPAGA